MGAVPEGKLNTSTSGAKPSASSSVARRLPSRATCRIGAAAAAPWQAPRGGAHRTPGHARGDGAWAVQQALDQEVREFRRGCHGRDEVIGRARGQAVETSHAGNQFVESVSPRDCPSRTDAPRWWDRARRSGARTRRFWPSMLQLRARRIAPTESPFPSEPRCVAPPQRPAAARAQIVAGHDKSFLCSEGWVRASAPSLSSLRLRRRGHEVLMHVCPEDHATR